MVGDARGAGRRHAVQRQRERRDGEGQGAGVEVAVRQDRAVVRHHERVVAGRGELHLHCRAGRRERRDRAAVHGGQAAEGERVLQPAGGAGPLQGAAGQQRPQAGRRLDLPGGRPRGRDAGVERREAGDVRLEAEGGGLVGAAQHGLRVVHQQGAPAGRDGVRRHQREAVLGRQRGALDQRQRGVREQDEVGHPDGADARHHRRRVALQQAGEGLGGGGRDPGPAGREPREPGAQGGAHDVVRQRRPHGRGAGADDDVLAGGVGRRRLAAARTQAARRPVDGRAGRDGGVERVAAGAEPRPCLVPEGDRDPLPRDPDDVLDGDPVPPQHDGLHAAEG